MTIQNAPPGLDYDRDKKFSKVLVFFLGCCSIALLEFQMLYVFCSYNFFFYKTKLIRGLSAVSSPLKKWLQCVW